MNHLLERMDQIAQSLSEDKNALALIGLGSVGTKRHRLDAYSDLDFFVIVTDGFADQFIEYLEWLNAAYPTVYTFKNTKDGYKVLFSDGIYAEFAVFNASVLASIPFSDAYIHWHQKDIDYQLPQSNLKPDNPPSLEYLFNEALTNIYVGLLRYLRGEYLSAYQYITNYALTNIIKTLPHLTDDIFNPFRRIELNHPEFSQLLPNILHDFKHIYHGAKTLLTFVTDHFDANPFLIKEIERLLNQI